MNCKNCGTIIQGNYCSHCGQNSKVDKITLTNLLEELYESVFQINKGFLFTVKELLIRPGEAIWEYLQGRRKNYFKPIAYVLTFSTIYFLFSQLTGQSTWLDEAITGFTSGVYEGTEVPPILTWGAKNFAYSTLLLLPVFSLASYISFSGLGRNYLEHVVLNSYITGQQAIFYSIMIMVRSFFDYEFFELLPIWMAFFYTLWVFSRFFKEGNRFINFLRSLLTYLLYVIFSAVVLFIFMGISALIN